MKYDDASWHYAGDFPNDLPPSAGATHIGLFLGWMLNHGFASEELQEEAEAEIAQLQARQLDGREFLLQVLDEKLTDQDFNDEGNAFALAYYRGRDHDSRYVDDYLQALGIELDDLYRAPHGWDSYDRVAPLMAGRLAQWRSMGRPQYID